MFTWRTTQGTDLAERVTLSPGTAFTGAEALSCTISDGGSGAALLTFVPTWVAASLLEAAQQLDVVAQGIQTATLPPGGYSVAIRTADDVLLAVGWLHVAPGVGAAPRLRSLITPAAALLLLPGLPQDQVDALPFGLEAATVVIEGHCRTGLALTDYDRIYRPEYLRIHLHSRPVATLASLAIVRLGPVADSEPQTITDAYLDADRGDVELRYRIPRGYGLSRGYGVSRGFGVRVVYRAGYAYLAADLALGYTPVPRDLQAVCAMTARGVLESALVAGPVQFHMMKDRQYRISDTAGLIPSTCLSALARYEDWGF